MRSFSLFLVMLAVGACAGSAPPRDGSEVTLTGSVNVANTHPVREIAVSSAARAVLAAPDRTPEDRALDDERQAADIFTFLGVEPGMRVAELGCGAGYTTELLARAVGPTGLVFAENPPGLVARTHIESVWAGRLARPANAKVVRVDRDFESPLPAEARRLDLVYLALFYQDLPALGVDRDEMNHAVHLALRPGGRYVMLDRAPVGAAMNAREMHGETSRNARREAESAGFRLITEGRFLRTSTDPRDWDAAPSGVLAKGEKEDRFILVFEKP